MKRFLAALALATLPESALAQGIDLTWKDCVGTGLERTSLDFTCTGTVNQTYNLILQFKLPADLPSFVSAVANLDYQNVPNAPLSPFWHYEAGGCNNPAAGTKGIAMSDNIQLLPNCEAALEDPWDGDGTGGFEAIAAYAPDFRRPGNGLFILGGFRMVPTPLAARTNYYAFHLLFNNRNRATCAGCADQGFIWFQQLTLESDDGAPAVELVIADKFSQCVTINGASPAYCGIDPAQTTSWHRLKSLYR